MLADDRSKELTCKGIKKLENEYNTALIQNLEASIESIREVACDLESNLFQLDPTAQIPKDKISNNKELLQLDEHVKVLAAELIISKRSAKYLHNLGQKIGLGEVEPDNAKDWFKEKLSSHPRINDQELAANEEYRTFRDSILKIRNPDETWGEEQDDDEIRMLGATIAIHCPLTVLYINVASCDVRSIHLGRV